jgi:hypothetical protein
MGHSELSPQNSQRGIGRGINDRRDISSLGRFFERIEYTFGGICLRLSQGLTACHDSIDFFRTCFANPTGSIVIRRQFASCRFRPEILLSYRGTPTRHQSSVEWRYSCMIYALLISKYPYVCTVASCSAIFFQQRSCIFTEWPPWPPLTTQRAVADDSKRHVRHAVFVAAVDR